MASKPQREVNLYEKLPINVLNIGCKSDAIAKVAVINHLNLLAPSHINVENAYEGKIQNKTLFLDKQQTIAENLAKKDDNDSNKTVSKKDNKKSLKLRLSSRQLKRAGYLHTQKKEKKCGKSQYIFTDMIKMNNLFNTYIKQLLGNNPRVNTSESRLVKADYHGACLEVIQSTQPNLIGVQGIVLIETQNSFTLLKYNNKIVTIPKRGVVFCLSLDDALFRSVTTPATTETAATTATTETTVAGRQNEDHTNDPTQSKQHAMATGVNIPYKSYTTGPHLIIYGTQLCIRSYERTTRKYKVTSTIEL